MVNILDKTAMDLEDIKKCLPHRDPLLLIEKIHELNLGENIIASKHLTENEPVFKGHFPGNPIYPGVYYIEGIAQSGAILSFLTREKNSFNDDRLGVLTSVDEARFRKPGKPGDRIRYEVKIEKMRGPFIWLKGTAFIEDEVAVECKLSIAIAPKKRFGK